MLSCRLLLFLPCVFVSASPAFDKRAFGVSSDPSDADGQTFDYIIVGAGLAGITVAGRLSEDPSKTVLLVEAGNDNRSNPLITNILNYGDSFGTDLEWRWDTDLGRFIRGGRTLGGSSSINNAVWTRGMKEQYDALSQLLSEEDAGVDWNFDSLFSYMKKSETFHAPDKVQRAEGANFIPEYHGFSGPVQVAFAKGMFGGPQQPAFVNAVRNLTGIDSCADIAGGDANCVTYLAHTINPREDDNRSSSAAAYLTPVEHERTNWLTLVGHRVTQVLLDGEAPKVTATGVQFKKYDSTGETFFARARLEVILASGAIGTPQVLQVSGIGDPSVLEPLQIPIKVSLPTVGRNLQIRGANNITQSITPSFNPDGQGPSNAIAWPSIRELFAPDAGSNGSFTASDVGEYIMAMYPDWAQSQGVNGLDAESLTTIFGVQANLLVNGDAPIAELTFSTAFPSDIGIRTWFQIPFSRGNVTIASPSIFVTPKVTANWFDVDFDLVVQTAAARASRKILNHPSFNGILTGELEPGTTLVADEDENGGTDEAWQAWILDKFDTVHHPVGTAAMMRRDLGGVVDGRLRVYDTTNLRVVDASILPLEISTHLQSSLYGVAEKAADIIKFRL